MVFGVFGPVLGLPGPRGPFQSNRLEKLPPGLNFQPLGCPGARVMTKNPLENSLKFRIEFYNAWSERALVETPGLDIRALHTHFVGPVPGLGSQGPKKPRL